MSQLLTCIFCKQHWEIADNDLVPKTVVCFQCEAERFKKRKTNNLFQFSINELFDRGVEA
jgi:hypothetical protein